MRGYWLEITASYTSLSPLCLSPRKKTNKDFNSTFFYKWRHYFNTPKGYMNTESMIFWVGNILKTYVTLIRSIIEEDALCVLIGDELKSHINERVEQLKTVI